MEEKVLKPWGSYQVLASGNDFKLKMIRVNPGGQLSLQSHKFRGEHWVIISGVGLAISGDKKIELSPNDSIHIPPGTKHRISNFGEEELVFIEVQYGTYFGEDDIIRYEDVYNRI